MMGRKKRRSETPAMRITVTSESRARRLTAQADASATPAGSVKVSSVGMLKTTSLRTTGRGMLYWTMVWISGNSVLPISMTTISSTPLTNGMTISPSK